MDRGAAAQHTLLQCLPKSVVPKEIAIDQRLDPPIIQTRALSQRALFYHHDQLVSCGLADLRATNALFDSIRAGVPLMETGVSESMMQKIYPQHGHASFLNQRGVLDVPVDLRVLVCQILPGTDRSMIRLFPSCLSHSLVGTLFLVWVRVHQSQPASGVSQAPLPLPSGSGAKLGLS